MAQSAAPPAGSRAGLLIESLQTAATATAAAKLRPHLSGCVAAPTLSAFSTKLIGPPVTIQTSTPTVLSICHPGAPRMVKTWFGADNPP